MINESGNKYEQQALKLLFQAGNYPGLVIRQKEEMEFLLWRNKSLGNFTSWTVFQVEKNYSCRRVIWKQRICYRLSEPDTYAVEIILPKKFIDPILNKLSNIEFTQDKIPSILIDGIENGVIRKDQKINWRDEGSKDLEQLNKWFQATLKQFESLFC